MTRIRALLLLLQALIVGGCSSLPSAPSAACVDFYSEPSNAAFAIWIQPPIGRREREELYLHKKAAQSVRRLKLPPGNYQFSVRADSTNVTLKSFFNTVKYHAYSQGSARGKFTIERGAITPVLVTLNALSTNQSKLTVQLQDKLPFTPITNMPYYRATNSL